MTILLAALLAQAVSPPTTQSTGPQVCAGGLLRADAGEACPFLLFFDSGEAEISRDAAAALNGAIAAWQSGSYSRVKVTGHSDRSGPAATNMRVSRARAAAIRQALVDKGVPAASIRVEARGEQQPIIDTADGVREPQNRRIEIRLQR